MTTPSAPMTGERMKEIEARHAHADEIVSITGDPDVTVRRIDGRAREMAMFAHEDRGELLAELKRRKNCENEAMPRPASAGDGAEIMGQLRKAAYDKADLHNSTMPYGVDDLRQEDTLYWRAAEHIAALTAKESVRDGVLEEAASLCDMHKSCGCGRQDCYTDRIPECLATAIRALKSRPTNKE